MNDYLSKITSKWVYLFAIIATALIVAAVFFGYSLHVVFEYTATVKTQIRDTTLEYSIVWNDLLDEELKISYQLTDTSRKSNNLKHDHAAGINVCVTSDEDAAYLFLNGATFRYDLVQHSLLALNPTDIVPDLKYFGRFEIFNIQGTSQKRNVRFLSAPNVGAGPKEPCSVVGGSE